jgi:hypothetical protein
MALDLRVADEVFIAIALLHREHPDRADFEIGEIVDRVAQENLMGELRPGVRVHATLHCVANRAPNPGRYRMLYATSASRRRLLQPGDPQHPERKGKIFPDPSGVPMQYHELIEWAKERYSSAQPAGGDRWLGGIFELFGLGKEAWQGQDPDAYVRSLREGWD